MTTSDPTDKQSDDPTRGNKARTKPGRQPKFSVDEIVGAALSLTAIHGLDALTMRSLASELNTSPMTLYRYVADREQIVNATVDTALSDLKLSPTPAIGNVHEWLLNTTAAARSCLIRYPGVADHLLMNGPTGPNGFSLMYEVCTTLKVTGRSPEQIAAAYDWLMTTMAAYVSKEERLGRLAGGPRKAANAFSDRYLLEKSKLEELAPIVATFTGDMPAAFNRTISAVVDAIVSHDAP